MTNPLFSRYDIVGFHPVFDDIAEYYVWEPATSSGEVLVMAMDGNSSLLTEPRNLKLLRRVQ